MTLRQALDWLTALQAKYGADVPVYFDCPHCHASFTPSTIEALALHFTGSATAAPTKTKRPDGEPTAGPEPS